MGAPAATRPTKGSINCAMPGKGMLKRGCVFPLLLPAPWRFSERNVSDFNACFKRMPREVPLTNSITPFRASACRCSSAALADLKPSSAAISARVGGAPVFSIAAFTRFKISCWRSVSLMVSILKSLVS